MRYIPPRKHKAEKRKAKALSTKLQYALNSLSYNAHALQSSLRIESGEGININKIERKILEIETSLDSFEFSSPTRSSVEYHLGDVKTLPDYRKYYKRIKKDVKKVRSKIWRYGLFLEYEEELSKALGVTMMDSGMISLLYLGLTNVEPYKSVFLPEQTALISVLTGIITWFVAYKYCDPMPAFEGLISSWVRRRMENGIYFSSEKLAKDSREFIDYLRKQLV